jgi:hypothetical protein
MSLYNIVDPVFAMLAMAALGPALRTGGRRDFVLAGMMAAVAQYFYHGSRLVLVLLGVLAVSCWLLVEKQEIGTTETQSTQRSWSTKLRARGVLISATQNSSEKAHWASRWVLTNGFLWMAFAFVALALPRFAPMVAGELPVEGNREVMRLPADFFPDNAVRAMLAWVGQPDVSPFWLSDSPLLLLPVLILFGMGLTISVRHWRDARCLVLLSWVILTTIFGGAIWTAAPLYVRYMTAVPAVALLIAVSFQRSALSPKRWVRLVGTGVFSFACLQGIVVSAWQHPADAQARITAGHWQEDAAARQAAMLPEGTSIVIIEVTFGTIERITLADYVAAYGARRAVGLATSSDQTEDLAGLLSAPVAVLDDD